MNELSDNGVEGPLSTFQSLFAEGDSLCKQGDYRKACDAFSKALSLKPGEKNALIARSKCFLLLGSPNSALVDAEEVRTLSVLNNCY
jgi:tetratricopeptide repeat protein 25